MKKTLAAALEERGYTTLTAVQEAVINPDLQGQDMLVSAQTGSGKTLGFGLAIAPELLGEADHFERASAPLALVIAPTRELALQVKRELSWVFAKAGAVIASTVGGMDMRDERRNLSRGAHIVVATPGRLRDHIMRETIDLSQLKAVVLDEADEMLDLGFREDLEFILEAAPQKRQTLMFSATVSPAIARLAKNYQRDAQRIATASTTKQHADIDYRAFRVAPRDGENAIINVLRFYEAPNAIVFCNTRAMVSRLTTRLSNRGFAVVALSGELSQNERTHALQAMRDGRARVCVATDVAARGIDLPNLDLVIHAELPSNQETLLHRSGRTGRAGRKGVSAMIVPPSNRKKAERLLGWAKLTAEWGEAPNAAEVSAKDEERMLASDDWNEKVATNDEGTVEKLIAAFTTQQIASAYLRMYRKHHSAPEELAAAGSAPERKPRESFGPSVWFSVPGGRNGGAEPRRLLPAFCDNGNISKDDIGAIRVQSDVSYVELKESSVTGFLSAIGPDMILEDDIVMTKLDKAPILERPERSRKPSYKDNKGGPRGGGSRKPREEYGNKSKDRDWKSDKPRGPRKEGSSFDDDRPKRPDYKKKSSSDRVSKPAERRERPSGKPDGFKKDRPAYKGSSDSSDKKRPQKPKRDFSDPSKRADSKAGGGKPAGKSFAKKGGKPDGKGGAGRKFEKR